VGTINHEDKKLPLEVPLLSIEFVLHNFKTKLKLLFKKMKVNQCGKDVEKKEPLYIVGGK
jgi:hypothetical protein